jgi:hypothetical protein
MRRLKVLVKSILLFKNWWMVVLARLGMRKKEFVLRFRNGISMFIMKPGDCVMGVYEVFGDEVYSRYVKNPKTVVDIGGGLGDFALYCTLRGAEQVLVYEMDRQRSEVAEKNIAMNRARNVRVFTEQVEKMPPFVCDLLKLDCEGCEYKVILESPEESFRELKNIAMEYHGTPERLESRLRNVGYKVRTVPSCSSSGYLYATREEF